MLEFDTEIPVPNGMPVIGKSNEKSELAGNLKKNIGVVPSAGILAELKSCMYWSELLEVLPINDTNVPADPFKTWPLSKNVELTVVAPAFVPMTTPTGKVFVGERGAELVSTIVIACVSTVFPPTEFSKV